MRISVSFNLQLTVQIDKRFERFGPCCFYFSLASLRVLPTFLLVAVPEVKVSDLRNLPGLFVLETVVVVWEDVAAVTRSHLVPGQYWPPSRQSGTDPESFTCVALLSIIHDSTVSIKSTARGRSSYRTSSWFPYFSWVWGQFKHFLKVF